MQVWLNHSRYPSLDMATDFTREQFAGLYKSFYDFASRYYGIDNLLTCSGVNPAAFISLSVFDVSKQSERLTEGVVDLNVRMEFSANVPMNTQAYALLSVTECLNLKEMGQRWVSYSRHDSQLRWSTVWKKYWWEPNQKIRLHSLYQTTVVTFKLHSVCHCNCKQIVTMNWQWWIWKHNEFHIVLLSKAGRAGKGSVC